MELLPLLWQYLNVLNTTLENLRSQFIKFENRSQAVQMEAYMKHHFSFFGIKAPKRNEIFRSIWKRDKHIIIQNWREVIEVLWQEEQREYQMIAIEILKKIYKRLVFDDLDYLMDLVKRKSWWDTVDLLASTPIGFILSLDKALQVQFANKWIGDENIWVQRVALIHQLKYKEKVDLDLLFDCILKIKYSKEFFLRKGAGWGLREASKMYPQEIASFLKENSDLSGLTKREGGKYVTNYL